MAADEVIVNQKEILSNQARILENQEKLSKVVANQAAIVANQESILANQAKLDKVLANQATITANQETISGEPGRNPAQPAPSWRTRRRSSGSDHFVEWPRSGWRVARRAAPSAAPKHRNPRRPRHEATNPHLGRPLRRVPPRGGLRHRRLERPRRPHQAQGRLPRPDLRGADLRRQGEGVLQGGRAGRRVRQDRLGRAAGRPRPRPVRRQPHADHVPAQADRAGRWT